MNPYRSVVRRLSRQSTGHAQSTAPTYTGIHLPVTGDTLLDLSEGGNNAQTNGPTTSFGYGTGPESAHIMWSTPGFTGCVMDARFGDYGYVTSHYAGLTFSPLILDGKIFYNSINSQMSEGWYCLDLYTGEQLYYHNNTGPVTGMGGGFDSNGAITQGSLSLWSDI